MTRPAVGFVALAGLAALVSVAPPSLARDTPYPAFVLSERRCHAHEGPPLAAPASTPLPSDHVEPLAHAARPPLLDASGPELDDVVAESTAPLGRIEPELPDTPRRHIVADHNDFRCLGAFRGEADILRVVTAGARDLRTRIDRRDLAALWDYEAAAGTLGIRSAIPALRAILYSRAGGSVDAEERVARLGLRTRAAVALASMGDRDAVPGIVALLRELETNDASERPTQGFTGGWREAFASGLSRFPDAAATYALDVLARRHVFFDDHEVPLLAVVDALEAYPPSHAAAAALLAARWPAHPASAHHWDLCQLAHARARVADAAFMADVRKELLHDGYNDICAEPTMLGAAMADLDPLLRGWDGGPPYEGIFRMIRTLDAASRAAPTAAVDVARRRLRAKLHESRPGRDVRAHQLAALAALGDAAAVAEARFLVGEGFLAGHDAHLAQELVVDALALDVPGAVDWAAELLVRETGSQVSGPTEVVAAMAERAPRDPRWVTGLLADDNGTQRVTLDLLGRLRPAGACEVFAGAVTSIGWGEHHAGLEFAFWSMTVMGEACRPAMERLVHDDAAPAMVRGFAREELAMIRVATSPPPDAVGPSRARIDVILASPE